jgi:hypothetical protein
MYARTNAFGPSMMFGGDWTNNRAYGVGMMGGMMNGGGNYGAGPGMMSQGRNGFGMGPGMMGSYGWNNQTNSAVTPLTVDQARASAEAFIQSLDLKGLEAGEVMIFDNNAYVTVKESETGLGAFELLVDPSSQVAYPEYGPNMMWNLKYGYLGHNAMLGGRSGMMGGSTFQTSPSPDLAVEMAVAPEQAVQYAQQYLDTYYAGATAATDPMQFPGYYTLDFEKDGKILGMLSVNGYNGQIFLHTWHGTFIEEAE